jgi:catechol 2,3-dioxygenase-like lactoylglutathione lyase family enzyme
MKLFRIIIPVGDIEEADGFYSRVFNVKGIRVSPGRHYFNLNGLILACYEPKADGDDTTMLYNPHPNQYLYFEVDNLEMTHGVFISISKNKVSQIDIMPWGERLFYGDDPWGNHLCFVDKTTLFRGN